ncbi:MAG: T9SS type A sorting domain-containing protein [Chitinophagaceae bacterium]|nr:T9SS type A sorting domain-containing protein [Chitinophagaceae bacterium]
MRAALSVMFFFLLFTGYAQVAAPVKKANLPTPALDELSGLINWNGKLYGHKDNGNEPVIFEIDSTTGAITKTILLTVNYTATSDWEDITQDDVYIYIGDFGNNATGSRKDLKIYRISKAAITAISGSTGTITADNIDIINFSYEDQTIFCSTEAECDNAANNTAFDCEAVIYDNGTLHLFTKDWVSSRTVHYTVPAIPGTYIASRKEEFNTQNFLITGATKLSNKVVALLGYNNPKQSFSNTHCAIWLLLGFSSMDNLLNTATQKLKLDLGKMFSLSQEPTDRGQLECITAVNNTRVLVAGERFTYSALSINVAPQLYGVNLDGFIPQEMVLSGSISNFISKSQGNAVELSWDYSDNESAVFEIQVSTTGYNNDFKTIERLNTSNTFPYSYSYSDNTTASGNVYYRIKVTTLGGQTLFSKILFIKNNNNPEFNLSVFPSPFTDKLTINFNSRLNQHLYITIADASGRSVITRTIQATTGNYNVLVDGLNNLSKGVYFLICRTSSNLVVKKIFKQ